MNHDPLDELVAQAARVRDGDLHTPATHTAAMALMKDITTMDNSTDIASPWAPTSSSSGAPEPPVAPDLGEYLPSRRRAARPKQWQRKLAVSIAAAAVIGAVIVGVNRSDNQEQGTSTANETRSPAVETPAVETPAVETPAVEPPVSVDGINVTYVPEGMVVDAGPFDPWDESVIGLRLIDPNDPDRNDLEGALLEVGVLRGPDANQDVYMGSHWFGATPPTPITVQGAPAFALHAIESDGQEEKDRKIVWFPHPELALSITSVDLAAPDEFDKFVEGLEVTR
jgi:hypothetical protein